MKEEKSLTIPLIICNVARLLLGIAFVAITIAFVHVLLVPAAYDEWGMISMSKTTSLSYKVVERWDVLSFPDANLFLLSNLTKASIIINYIQLSLIIGTIFLITSEFCKIIQSVRDIETFHSKNVGSFSKITKYLLVVFVLSSITVLNFNNASIREFSPSLSTLCCSIIAFILSRVFYQGNQIYEENKLTI